MRILLVRLRTVLFCCVSLLLAVLLFAVSAFVASSGAIVREGAEVPVLMYHGILKDKKFSGRYVITPDEFEADLKRIQERGYETITVQQLIDYVYHSGVLPEKPVMLTFDDGYYNNYLYAYPLLQEYNMKAVFSVIGAETDKWSEMNRQHANYSHMTWQQLKELQRSGLVEIQNHSYNLHTTNKGRQGTKKVKSESGEAYRAFLMGDIGRLQDEMQEKIGVRATTFVYPFGAVSNASFPIIKDMGFLSSFSCQAGVNYIQRKPESLYMLRRNLRVHGKAGSNLVDKLVRKPEPANEK